MNPKMHLISRAKRVENVAQQHKNSYRIPLSEKCHKTDVCISYSRTNECSQNKSEKTPSHTSFHLKTFSLWLVLSLDLLGQLISPFTTRENRQYEIIRVNIPCPERRRDLLVLIKYIRQLSPPLPNTRISPTILKKFILRNTKKEQANNRNNNKRIQEENKVIPNTQS